MSVCIDLTNDSSDEESCMLVNSEDEIIHDKFKFQLKLKQKLSSFYDEEFCLMKNKKISAFAYLSSIADRDVQFSIESCQNSVLKVCISGLSGPNGIARRNLGYAKFADENNYQTKMHALSYSLEQASLETVIYFSTLKGKQGGNSRDPFQILQNDDFGVDFFKEKIDSQVILKEVYCQRGEFITFGIGRNEYIAAIQAAQALISNNFSKQIRL